MLAPCLMIRLDAVRMIGMVLLSCIQSIACTLPNEGEGFFFLDLFAILAKFGCSF